MKVTYKTKHTASKMNRNGKRYAKASPNVTRPEAIPLKFNNYLCGSIVFYSILFLDPKVWLE